MQRSYRRFDEAHRVARETLVALVGLARCTPSAANRQPLKYILAADQQTNDRIFPCLAWATYLKVWEGVAPGWIKRRNWIFSLPSLSLTEDVKAKITGTNTARLLGI
jgi:nitroreductase